MLQNKRGVFLGFTRTYFRHVARMASIICDERLVVTGARIAALLSLCALIGSVLAVHGVPQAFAVQGKPPTDWSYYMNSDSTSEAYTLGCNQGTYDKAHGTDSETLLDFGGQLSADNGAEMINGVNIGDGHIEAVADSYSQGYWTCSAAGNRAYLGIGTNNSLSVNSAGGATWALIVNAVESYNASKGYSSQVTVGGADDMEPGFGSASAATAWATSFSGHNGGVYYNYGSADGCPQSQPSGVVNGSCNNGWTQEDEWYLSWGNASAEAVPEIYYTAQAHQWATLSLFSARNHTNGPIHLQGPLDEYDLDTSTLSPTSAWTDMWTYLNNNAATAQNMPFSLEIHQE